MSESRRESRESASKRHRSRFDREPSPKKSRRDGKPATERELSNNNADRGDHTDRDQKHRRRPQDALLLEAPLISDPKAESGAAGRESDKKPNGHDEVTRPSDPTEVPRSRSYFQHDERGSARQVGRNFGRRATTDRGWRDSKDQNSERTANKISTHDTRQRDEKSEAKADDKSVWGHDGFFGMEANPPPSSRKRPAFREKKTPVDPENVEKASTEPTKPSPPDRGVSGSERREEKAQKGHNPRHSDRSEKPFVRDRGPNRGEAQRDGFLSRERYGGGGGGNYRERDRFSGRQGHRLGGTTRGEKWKHDLFHEANRSPTPKNEEDQIAKVEALLAS